MGYNLLLNEVYWGYNPFANHLLTSWDIQVDYLGPSLSLTFPSPIIFLGTNKLAPKSSADFDEEIKTILFHTPLSFAFNASTVNWSSKLNPRCSH